MHVVSDVAIISKMMQPLKTCLVIIDDVQGNKIVYFTLADVVRLVSRGGSIRSIEYICRAGLH